MGIIDIRDKPLPLMDMKKLPPPRLFVIACDGFERFVERQAASGARLGEIKPAAMSRLSGWSDVFAGAYLERSPRGLAVEAH